MTAEQRYQQAFRDEIRAFEPASLCDVGCGAGVLLAHLRSIGIAATGLDPDPARVAEGQADGLDLVAGRAESLPFADASFDLVTFENALHHVTDISRALQEAMRVARRAVVILDPWFDLSIPSQRTGDRFERWLEKLDRIGGMVHWDPIPSGAIVAACPGAASVSIRHLLELTPVTREAFEALAARAAAHRGAPAYKDDRMEEELAAIREEVARTGITEAGALATPGRSPSVQVARTGITEAGALLVTLAR